MKKIEDMSAKELTKLADEKRLQEWENSVTHIGYLKQDLYDYNPEDGGIDFCSRIGKTKEEIGKCLALDLKKAEKALPLCISLCIKKGSKFYKRRGQWEVEKHEEILGSLYNEDLDNSWAKRNLVITKVDKKVKKSSTKKSSMLCDHANEVPAVCKCPSDCYCKDHTCKEKR